MTMPPAPPALASAEAGSAAQPVAVVPSVLRFRRDFLLAARARRHGTPGFLLQARQRGSDEVDSNTVRLGFTCSRKIGNAVTRNRAKRRLRALARAEMPLHARPGWDYVLVARPGATVTRDFAAMRADLRAALRRVHADRAGASEGMQA